MAQVVAKDLGCEEAFARYLQTLPPVGTVLVRHFGDRDYRVTVTDEGFMLGRHRYRSLSAVAKAITGKHWNWFLFFGLDTA
jgi:hypothetical protein